MKKMVLALVFAGFSFHPAYADEADNSNVGSASPAPSDMIVTTTSAIDGYHVKEYKGIVRGVTVRQPTITQNLAAGFQKLAGGKIGSYVQMVEKARQTAYDLCLNKARELGANAIVGVKYDSAASDNGGQPVTEVLCYGTAVVIEKDSK